MLLAQLHRKVPSEFEGMEDVLTSSVVGLLRYLPSQVARTLLAEFASIPVPQAPLKIELWPRYATPPGFRSSASALGAREEPASRGDTEPDAVITSSDWLVLIEAKFRSQLDQTYGQLGREFALGYQLAQDTGCRFRLLLITGHALRPSPGGRDLVSGVQSALTAASGGLGDLTEEMMAAVPTSLQWVNWQQLHGILLKVYEDHDISTNTRWLLRDVCHLLELRGLTPYDARPIVRAVAHWDEAGIPDEMWTQPVLYGYRTVQSITAGWEQLLRLDATTLGKLAWYFNLPTADFDLAAHLARFQLDSLQDPAWQPFTGSGD